MPQMIAKKPFRYAGRDLRADDSFLATAADVRTLTVVGLARLEVVETRRRYRRRDMQASQ
jgi:hypothetical protein